MSNRSIDPAPAAAVIRVPPVHPVSPVHSMKHSPREILGQLLDSGKLSASELREVRRVYDALIAGRVGRLTSQQNRWAEQLCRTCGVVLSRAKPRAREDKETARETQQRLLHAFEAMPRPKAPPGRR